MNSTNRTMVPEARRAMDTMKNEIAAQMGIADYGQASKGDLTSRQNGSIGGEMVRRMIRQAEENMSGK